MATKSYEGPGITVHWDAERCQHSGRCVAGSPNVFDTAARPWIRADGAGAAEIAATIDTCPSGALSYTRTDGAANGRRGFAAGEDPARARQPDA
ncbi:MAG: (4Fe-4S)-binding protein [Acidimicrobiales bacterium]|nr:(4Fe-4S)-binding protein [Acidimicrobiales bacterium]HRW37857.1 (4Fe-4S)-binding protein [Aquihabitans sp.]